MSETGPWRRDVGQAVLLAGAALKNLRGVRDVDALATKLDAYRRRARRHDALALFVPGASAFSADEDLEDACVLVGIALHVCEVDEPAVAIARDAAMARLRSLPSTDELGRALGYELGAAELHLLAVGPAGSAHLSRASGSDLVWTPASSPCRIRLDAAPATPSFDEHYSAEMPWVHWTPGTPKTAWLADARANDDGAWLLSARGF